MPGDKNYQVVLEDEDVLIVDKPSGLRTIPDGYQPLLPCLAKQLREDFGNIYVVHRLDKETSGVILFAKNAKAHRILNIQFKNRQVEKSYHAICAGYPEWKSITADFPLKVNGDRRHRTTIDFNNGKPAQSEFSILFSEGHYHLVSILPHNGYTHIIRAHAAALAVPLVSDKLYRHSAVSESIQIRFDVIPRVALHAFRLQFIHPTFNQPVSVKADYPPDFQRACELLSLKQETGA